jgi:formiminotetrahydrofolate cyclodeaminase
MMIEKSIKEFLDELASSKPTPGGGGAAALVGAVGAALGSMVGNLTNKRNIKDRLQQSQIEALINHSDNLRIELMELIEKDAAAFEALWQAYNLPGSTVEEKLNKEETMEYLLCGAGEVPLEIMDKVFEMICIYPDYLEIGIKAAISDVAVGVQLCRSALLSASVNVFINTKYMRNREVANKMNNKAQYLIDIGVKKADDIYDKVKNELFQLDAV